MVGGSLSDRIGGKPVMTISLWCTAICTMLIPVAVKFGTTSLWLVLFIEGMLQVLCGQQPPFAVSCPAHSFAFFVGSPSFFLRVNIDDAALPNRDLPFRPMLSS